MANKIEGPGSDGTKDQGNGIELLTAQEVVRTIFCGKISYRRLLQLTHNGSLNALRLGHTYFYNGSEVRTWLEKNLKTPAWAKVKA